LSFPTGWTKTPVEEKNRINGLAANQEFPRYSKYCRFLKPLFRPLLFDNFFKIGVLKLRFSLFNVDLLSPKINPSGATQRDQRLQTMREQIKTGKKVVLIYT